MSAAVLATAFIAVVVGMAQTSIADTAATSSDAADTRTITIENMRFDPMELTVKRGTRIIWRNQDLFPHTATAKSFDSGSIDANKSWTYVADKPGDYAYWCAFHPTMKGRLIVQ
jgi:plastocyanin